MSEPTLDELRYPIGKFKMPELVTPEIRRHWTRQIAETPAGLRAAVKGLNAQQLATPYRPDGWTVQQVAHHIPDSQMHAYIRFKLALTENEPTVKPFDEVAWTKLADVTTTPVEVSVVMLEAIHDRWVRLIESLGESDFKKVFHHPEAGVVSLDKCLGMYAWHGMHHVAHIARLRARLGW